MCAATGSSPTRSYDLLAERKRKEPEMFKHLRILKLDEWMGLEMSDQGSCETYLRRHLIEPLDISEDRYFSFRSDAKDPQAECRRMRIILAQQGRIDLSILGIGTNGHLAMNEPDDELMPGPHVAKLSESSLHHPMIRHSKVPVRYGLTFGMADLIHSRRILLLLSGSHKRAAMRRLMTEKITTHFPASLLQLHSNVSYLCDKDAVA